ncbi:MAG: hypothetical protein JW776_08535 [Candidatus Lokiarchaeota archaeon]|nr:hypothetical protein [Candidatus Lokiarchaeota archaeon]
MSSRTTIAYKPLINAGTAILTIRLFTTIYSGSIIILVVLIPSISSILSILLQVPTYIGFLASLLLLIFILKTFQRMEIDPRITSDNKNRIKVGKISTLILIIILSLVGIFYMVVVIFYVELSLITLSEIMAYILIYSLIVLEIINGIFVIITFVCLSKILWGFDDLVELRIFLHFTRWYGIFVAIGQLIAGITLIVLLPTGSTVFIEILLIVSLTSSIFTGIAGIFQIVIAIGFILIGRRLNIS